MGKEKQTKTGDVKMITPPTGRSMSSQFLSKCWLTRQSGKRKFVHDHFMPTCSHSSVLQINTVFFPQWYSILVLKADLFPFHWGFVRLDKLCFHLILVPKMGSLFLHPDNPCSPLFFQSFCEGDQNCIALYVKAHSCLVV